MKQINHVSLTHKVSSTLGQLLTNPLETQADCIRALKPLLKTFKCLGVTPLKISKADVISVKHSPLRIISLLGITVLIFLMMETLHDIITILTDGDDSTSVFESVNGLIYYAHVFLVLILMSRKSSRIPELIDALAKVERMVGKYSFDYGIVNKSWLIFGTILAAQLLSEVLFCIGVASRVRDANRTWEYEDFLVGINKIDLSPDLGHSSVLGIMVISIALFCDVVWTFGEHLYCTVAFILAVYFARYNKGISHSSANSVQKIEEMRQDHRQLKELVDVRAYLFNSIFSSLIFVTYMGNLGYLLTRLYIGVSRDLSSTSLMNAISSLYSTLFLTAKIFVPTWFAARVHERANEALDTVHDWSSGYGTEDCRYRIMVINRFVSQLVTDPVYFNGLGYFVLTKTFIVTLISGILGYQVIILQFHLASKSTPTAPTNVA